MFFKQLTQNQPTRSDCFGGKQRPWPLNGIGCHGQPVKAKVSQQNLLESVASEERE